MIFCNNLSLDDLAKISDDLEDYKLPYMVDLSLFEKIENQDLKYYVNKVEKFFDKGKFFLKIIKFNKI